MAEANAVIGQTYNAKQQKVYPKVVAQSFVVDDTVHGSTDEFNNVVRTAIKDMSSDLVFNKITLVKNSSIEVRKETSSTNFMYVDGNGNIQFASEHISDKEGVVKIFNGKVVVDETKLTITNPSIEAKDASMTINRVDTSILTAKQIDTSTLTLANGLHVSSVDTSILTNHAANIEELYAKNAVIDACILIKRMVVGDASIFDMTVSGDLNAMSIDASTLSVSVKGSITDLDVSTLKATDSVSSKQVDASNITVKVKTSSKQIDASTLNSNDASIINLMVENLSISNVVLLRQLKELPKPSQEFSEQIVQYIGPTYHEQSEYYAHIQKNDFVRCVMDYRADSELDSSAYLYSDFDSFEPETTLRWLKDAEIAPASYVDGVFDYKFTLLWKNEKYFVTIDKGEGDYIDVGGDIYNDSESPKRHIYCPYVWDSEFEPSTDVVLTYNIEFNTNNYTWKPVH